MMFCDPSFPCDVIADTLIEMLLSVISICVLVLTAVRSWPQFLRIVLKKQREGVSALTWVLALANHMGWFSYGVLSDLPLIVAANVVAITGCAGIVVVMRSWKHVACVSSLIALLSVLLYWIADPVLLTFITMLTIGMFIPQLVRVLRTSTQGVSLTTWILAALGSTGWVAYAMMIDRPLLVVAHYVMLPASLVIVVRVFAASRSNALAVESQSG